MAAVASYLGVNLPRLALAETHWLAPWWWNWELHVPPSDAPSESTLDMVAEYCSNYESSDSENSENGFELGNDYIAMMTDDEQDDDVN